MSYYDFAKFQLANVYLKFNAIDAINNFIQIDYIRCNVSASQPIESNESEQLYFQLQFIPHVEYMNNIDLCDINYQLNSI